MPTSYANLCGTGNRLRYIQPRASAGFLGHPERLWYLISGDFAPGLDMSGLAAGVRFIWDFGNVAYLIDEARWYQSGNNTHGDWRWQGSNDGGLTWADIGIDFTLGGGTFNGTNYVQTQDTLHGNLATYQTVSLLHVSGAVSNGPWLLGIEFRIDGPFDSAGTSYENPAGAGYRQAQLTPPPPQLVDCTLPALPLPDLNFFQPYVLVNQKDPPDIGIFRPDGTWFWHRDPVAGDYFRFDFGNGLELRKQIDEVVLWSSQFDNQVDVGTWKWQGSKDGSVWLDIGGTFDLKRPDWSIVQRFDSLWGNTKGYRFLQLLAVAPVALSSSLAYFAFEFRVAAAAPEVTLARLNARDLALASSLNARWLDPTGAEFPTFPLRGKL